MLINSVRKISFTFLATSVALLSSACTSKLSPPDLGSLYSKSAQYHGLERNPIIVIPGVLGSRLENSETGSTVWGAYTGKYANPKTEEGLKQLALPMEIGAELKDLKDKVKSTAVLDRIQVNLLGVPLEIRPYFDILATLGAGGYRDQTLGMLGEVDYGSDHFSCFQFPYDWRRDIVESAKKLGEFIEEKKSFIRSKQIELFGASKEEIRFDMVAHSMGGLVLRYYLRYGSQDLPRDGSLPELTWEGAKNVDKVVLVATPNAGSLDALGNLVNGTTFPFPAPKYPPALLGTYPSLYQLLPRARHGSVKSFDTKEKLNLMDPKLWADMGWGLADPDSLDIIQKMLPQTVSKEEALRIALDHQAKLLARAKHLHQSLDLPAVPPEDLKFAIFIGDAVQTLESLELNKRNQTLVNYRYAPGDKLVTRASALMDERLGSEWQPFLKSPVAWDRVFFIFKDHIALTKDKSFADNILFYLLEQRSK